MTRRDLLRAFLATLAAPALPALPMRATIDTVGNPVPGGIRDRAKRVGLDAYNRIDAEVTSYFRVALFNQYRSYVTIV